MVIPLQKLSTAATAAEAPTRRSFRDVWLIAAGHMLTHWYPSTFYLLLPLIGNELGLSFGQIGAILSCQSLAGALSNVPGGMAVDAVSRKGLLMGLALFWVGVPYLAMGFTHSYATLLGCAALVGIGNNIWHPTAIPLLAQSYPGRRGLVVSIHGMGGNLGDALAPLVVGQMLNVLSWRNVVVLNVIPGVVAAGLVMIWLGRRSGGAKGERSGARRGQVERGKVERGQVERGGVEPSEAAPAPRRNDAGALAGLRLLLANRTVLMLSLGSAMRAMTASTLLTFLPVFLSDELGYSPPWVGGAMFTLQAAGFAAAPITGHLSDRMGRRRIIMTSMAVSAMVLAFMAVAGRSSAFVFFVAFLGFFLFAVRAVLQAWLLDATPRHMAGTSIGIMFGSQALGAAIGPLAGGLLADHYGLMATFYFLAVTIVVANMFIFFIPTAESGKQPQPATA